MIEERPFFGIGPELVKRRYGIYREPTAPRLETPHLHNAYLQIGAERGLVSLTAFLWLLGSSSWAAVRGFRREGGVRGPRADLWLGCLLAVSHALRIDGRLGRQLSRSRTPQPLQWAAIDSTPLAFSAQQAAPTGVREYSGRSGQCVEDPIN